MRVCGAISPGETYIYGSFQQRERLDITDHHTLEKSKELDFDGISPG
jgi:hypothetical protein